jgi:hypothetical protein
MGRHAPTGAGRVASPGGFPMGRSGVPGRLRVGSSMFLGRDGMLPQVLDVACGVENWGLESRPSPGVLRWKTEDGELGWVYGMAHTWTWYSGVALGELSGIGCPVGATASFHSWSFGAR